MFEIYMEDIRDLLNPNNEKKISIRESPVKGIFLENLAEICVAEEVEVESILASGTNNRK